MIYFETLESRLFRCRGSSHNSEVGRFCLLSPFPSVEYGSGSGFVEDLFVFQSHTPYPQ